MVPKAVFNGKDRISKQETHYLSTLLQQPLHSDSERWRISSIECFLTASFQIDRKHNVMLLIHSKELVSLTDVCVICLKLKMILVSLTDVCVICLKLKMILVSLTDVCVLCVKVKMVFTRLRREFGAPIKFEDRKIDKTREPYKECASFEDPSFVLKRNEMDTHVQVIPCDSV